MAGDSEQTLQHQQPNGGGPFLIGVSGGTASGKVRGSALLPPGPARRPWAAAVSAAAAPRGPRASLLAALQLRLRRGLGARRGGGQVPGGRGLGVSATPAGSFSRHRSLVARVLWGRGGAADAIVLQVGSLLGTGLGVGSPASPQCIPFPASRGRAPSRAARCRRRSDGTRPEAARARGARPGEGAPLGLGLQGFSGKILSHRDGDAVTPVRWEQSGSPSSWPRGDVAGFHEKVPWRPAPCCLRRARWDPRRGPPAGAVSGEPALLCYPRGEPGDARLLRCRCGWARRVLPDVSFFPPLMPVRRPLLPLPLSHLRPAWLGAGLPGAPARGAPGGASWERPAP